MVELSAVSVLITVCATACTSIIHAIQASKCTNINLCGISCIRKVPDVQEEEPEETLNS